MASAKFFPAERFGISLLFLMNGFVAGSWSPKIPEFKARLGLTETGVGLMIMAFGIGSLIAMPLVGAIISRHGSRLTTLFGAVILSIGLLVLTLAPSILTAGLFITLLGASLGGMDVAMNANAVSVEKKMDRAIMSSCHGFWSLGAMIGSGLGGIAIAAMGVLNHVWLVTALCVVALIVAWRLVLDDRAVLTGEGDASLSRAFPRHALPFLIGAVALICMIPEGSVIDWGALYLRQEHGADVALSGFAFAAFSATMALMRFLGDGVRNRFGAVRTLRVSCLFAGAGLVIAALAPDSTVVFAGFAIAGIGIANMVPIAFSAAGNLPGMAPGIALSVVTFMGYAGILFAPSLIGFIGEHTGFAPIYLVLGLFMIPVFAMSGLMRHADRHHGQIG